MLIHSKYVIKFFETSIKMNKYSLFKTPKKNWKQTYILGRHELKTDFEYERYR